MRQPGRERLDPYHAAANMGVEVVRCEMFTSEGMWSPETSTVVLNRGMGRVREECALTHQLAHVLLGHNRELSAWDEWQADRLAASFLVPVRDFERHFHRCGSMEELAFELGVTEKIALAFMGMLSPEWARSPLAV